MKSTRMPEKIHHLQVFALLIATALLLEGCRNFGNAFEKVEPESKSICQFSTGLVCRKSGDLHDSSRGTEDA